MSKDEDKLIHILKSLPLFAKNFLKIRTKSGSIEPFVLNRAQEHIHSRLESQKKETGKVRALILKGRQQGCSTYVQARDLHIVCTTRGKKAFILTHEAEATKNLFEMTKRYIDNIPDGLIPEPDNSSAKELLFRTLDSGYAVGTAGNKSVGRSQTIQVFHGCLAEGSLVIDQDTYSLRAIESFNVGDYVRTHDGLKAPILFISSQLKECTNLTFRGLRSFPLVATKEHRFWTKEGWKELKDLKIGDSIGFPVFNIIKSKTEYDLPDPLQRKQGGGRQFVGKNTVKSDYNLGRLLGLYLADGHIKLQHKPPFMPCSLSFIIHRKETDRTIKWLSSFTSYYSSIKINHRDNCLTTEVIVYGNRLSRLIEAICGRTKEKHFPADWMYRGSDFCRGLLHGYLAGDGSFSTTDRRIRATSIYSAITIVARDIAASLGYGWASIEYKKEAIRYERNEKEAFVFSLCGSGVFKLAKELGKKTPEIKNKKTTSIKNNAANTTELSNGYAWPRITMIENAGIKQVYDFEIDNPAHSYCTIHGATHNSEVAYWPNAEEHAKGILQAVPNEPNTEIILESTANGIGNYFYNMWMAASTGQSEFQAIFVPWYWQPEYRIFQDGKIILSEDEESLHEIHGGDGLTHEHLLWRRRKLLEFSNDYDTSRELFGVEYPMTALDAFRNPVSDRFIKAPMVIRARKARVESESPLVIGIDPAISDNDRTAIIRRRGRLSYGLETHFNLNTMELVGLIRRIIDKDRPSKVCIDCIGIGAGIVDRLLEIGYDMVEGVNVARSANDKDKFRNLRAELWHDMREWLAQEIPVQIPDSDELLGDLTSLGYKFDSSGRLLIESKDDLRKRGMKSPDTADALALTFYVGDYYQQGGYAVKRLSNESAGMLI